MKLRHDNLFMIQSSQHEGVRGTTIKIPRYWIFSYRKRTVIDFFRLMGCPIKWKDVQTNCRRGKDREFAYPFNFSIAPGTILNSRETGTVHIHYEGDFNSILIVRSEAAQHPVFGSSQYDGRVQIELTGRWLYDEYLTAFLDLGFVNVDTELVGFPHIRP